MFKSSTTRRLIGVSASGAAGLLAAASLLGGCVAQVRVADPPVRIAPTVAVEVRAYEAPPPLPYYEQPPCPEEGYLWTPGYWAFAGGYYWVPGTWVRPPRFGVLWTPGYWGFVGGVYLFHAGYWGPHVGFYGGVNYGHGYGGIGFAGGRWVGNSYTYNRSVTNVNVTVVHNTYNETVINNHVTINKVSYNGGAGGVAAAPTAAERVAMREQHVAPTPVQHQHMEEAGRNPALFARSNGGRPPIAATPRPAMFKAPGVVGARGANPALEHEAAKGPPARYETRGERPPVAQPHPETARPRAERPSEKASKEKARQRDKRRHPKGDADGDRQGER